MTKVRSELQVLFDPRTSLAFLFYGCVLLTTFFLLGGCTTTSAPRTLYGVETAYEDALSGAVAYEHSASADPAVAAHIKQLDAVAYPLVMSAEAAARGHAADADSQLLTALVAVQNLAAATPKAP